MLVDHSTEVRAGDEVILIGYPIAEGLLVAVAECCGERGANVTVFASSLRIQRAHRRVIDPEDGTLSEVALASVEAADVYIAVRAATNTYETSDVDPETNSRFAAVNKEVLDTRLGTRWVDKR